MQPQPLHVPHILILTDLPGKDITTDDHMIIFFKVMKNRIEVLSTYYTFIMEDGLIFMVKRKVFR